MEATDQLPQASTWQLIGGHPALDLANTVSWRHDPGRRLDRLSSRARLADWLRHLPASDVQFAGQQENRQLADLPLSEPTLVAIRALRDSLTRIMDAQLDGESLPQIDLEVVEGAWRRAVSHSSLVDSLPTGWQVRPSAPDQALHVLALVVGRWLTEADLSRLRRCDGKGCAWFFLDTSRNHSRRWCDPADCGNRARVRRYAQKHASRKPVPC